MSIPRETYQSARARLIREAMALGWQVRTHSASGRELATPWIALPRGEENDDVRCYLRPRALHATRGRFTGAVKTDWDMRGLAVAELGQRLERWI